MQNVTDEELWAIGNRVSASEESMKRAAIWFAEPFVFVLFVGSMHELLLGMTHNDGLSWLFAVTIALMALFGWAQR